MHKLKIYKLRCQSSIYLRDNVCRENKYLLILCETTLSLNCVYIWILLGLYGEDSEKMNEIM